MATEKVTVTQRMTKTMPVTRLAANENITTSTTTTLLYSVKTRAPPYIRSTMGSSTVSETTITTPYPGASSTDKFSSLLAIICVLQSLCRNAYA
ncbi:unnamed protein product [Gongylonema pulchrum]|uniref:Uncharacterized protein n=1 Tax=Gongylonema pulchrum TaxID=637853 RepID=A0A183D8M4_9BILA|nr:unnamed protein product [Gongylonema pulchrum]